MQNNSNLIKKFSERTELRINKMCERQFNDKVINEEYVKNSFDILKPHRLLMESTFLIYNIFICYYGDASFKLPTIILYSGYSIVNLILLFIVYNNDPNTMTSKIVYRVKAILMYVFFYLNILINIFYRRENLFTVVVRNYYIQLIFLLLDMMFFSKFHSYISMFILNLIYLILFIFMNISIYTLELQSSKYKENTYPFSFFCNKYSYSGTFHGLKIDKIKKEKEFYESNLMVINEFINITNKNFTVIDENKNSINLKNLDFEEIYKFALDKNLSSLDLVVINNIKQHIMNSKNYEDVNSLIDSLIFENKIIIENDKELILNCIYRQYSTEQILYLDNFISHKYDFSLIISHNFEKMIPEICISIFSFITFLLSANVHNNKMDNFKKLLLQNLLIQYFEGMINNMNVQVLSFSENKLMNYNKAYEDNFIKDCKNCESQKTENEKYNFTSSVNENIKKDENFDKYSNSVKYLDQNSLKELKIFKDHLALFDKKKSNEDKNKYSKIKISNMSEIFDINFFDLIKFNTVNSSILNHFENLGIYINKKNNRYYKILLRCFLYNNNTEYIADIIFDDITEIIEAEKISSQQIVKQKIFSKIAHELKTPLIIIKSLIKDLELKDDANNKATYENLLNTSDFISFLIVDIIYSSNSNSIKINFENIDLQNILDFCHGVIKTLLVVMPGNKKLIEVQYFVDEEISNCLVRSDGTRLKQIMLNFISNAVKFTKFGKITLKAELIGNDKKEILISVTDTGIGMKKEDLQKILSKDDNQLNINTDYEYNDMGTGLGINITKDIISKLDHKFYVESKFGKGSIFGVIIDNISYIDKDLSITTKKLSTNDINLNMRLHFNGDIINSIKESKNINYNDKNIQFSNSLNNNSINHYFDQSNKILVVDDSSTMRKSVINLLIKNNFLKENNFKFLEGQDGIDMIKLITDDQLRGNYIKIVITDENMEYMNGSKAISILKDMEKIKKIKRHYYVSLTAFSDDETKYDLMKKGANLVITKPLSNSILEKVIINFQEFIKNDD